MGKNRNIRFPAEWETQDGVQLTWPHAGTDWCGMLDEVTPCFVAIAREIAVRERLLIVCHDVDAVRGQLGVDVNFANVRFCVLPSNDTWARDHAALSVFENGEPALCDFAFNGWGLKFAANLDNLITRRLVQAGVFAQEVRCRQLLGLVLEGGSVESDGQGTILTTEACLLSPNRNGYETRYEAEVFLRQTLGAQRVLWLRHGHLAGDDTDSHIDTLARFCTPNTIAYVSCDDPGDEHREALKKMEQELLDFRTLEGRPYALVPLPMAEPVFEDCQRLPATYANFLIINGAVLMPTYASPKDAVARERLQQAFPDREIVGIDCRPLIRQHGSLHCVTMQYPAGFLTFDPALRAAGLFTQHHEFGNMHT
ncbi:MAG: agmatine deiminase family protein [Kiritimatiellae bacterium]|nr:agmatine deiminase family protein [Kiritimatiellia bacterium]